MRALQFILAVCALVMAGCAAAVAQPATAGQPAGVVAAYQVGPGDILKVSVYRAPDYDSVVQIAEDGTVPFSVIGKVHVSGLTPAAVAERLADKLTRGAIFKNPVVSVLVQEYHYRTVFVLGSVQKPGEYPLERGDLRLSDLLARAGAALGGGVSNVKVTLLDGTSEDLLTSDIVSGKGNRLSMPGETIMVGTPTVFYISGEVQHSGSYPLEPGLTVGRAIALAGGLGLRGSRTKIKITRLGDDSKENLVRAKSGDLVLPKDLIVVGARIF